jgi:hypothetical protein
MAKIKMTCPRCGQFLECDEKHRGETVKCPFCKDSIPVPPISSTPVVPLNRRRAKRRFILVAYALALIAVIVAVGMWMALPNGVHWPDRRPIGVLFLASNDHSSATNPRGWFNNPSLDVTGTNGLQNFRKALLNYTDQSIAVLKRAGAQGVIVWDLEGEEFPHKTTFIGDPRLLNRLAPEMAPVVDEFFRRLRNAGLRVGLTVRPQQLVFDNHGLPRQKEVLNIKRILLEKIDYARTRWGATIFYVDSNRGIWRPDEVWQLCNLAKQRPDILLIPEHHDLLYSAFSAPYVSLRKGGLTEAAEWERKLFPESFRALDISDASSDEIAAAWHKGDVLLFRAWYWNSDCQLLENFEREQQ